MSAHWSEKYIGKPYNKKHNCTWFVNFVLKNEFNKDVEFPKIEEHKRVSEESFMIEKLICDFGYEILPDELKDGDGVLMRYHGTKNWHLGIFFKDQNGRDKVMHSDNGFGSSVAHRFIDLSFVSINIVAFYRFN